MSHEVRNINYSLVYRAWTSATKLNFSKAKNVFSTNIYGQWIRDNMHRYDVMWVVAL